jgi:hypothetical protein
MNMSHISKKSRALSRALIAAFAVFPLASATRAAEKPAAAASTDWQKPAWLTDLALAVKENYDNNLLLVADKSPGMSPQSSWITTLSPKVGFDLAPLLGDRKTLQTLSLVYSPDFAIYHDASSESYNAHKIANVLKVKIDNFSFSLNNAFLFNDGDRVAPIYAMGQGAAIEQADSKRNAYATAVPRERRKQIQDRFTFVSQYDVDKLFLRPTASLLYYDLMTDWHSTGAAPYKGYQNYIDRSDINGGVDLGIKASKDLTFIAGCRYGHQYQQDIPHAIDSATVNGRIEQSSADYRRFLLGLEGKPCKWLAVKLAGGPENRNYNAAAPVDNYHPVDYYGEGSLIATLDPSQNLSFTYKHWQWVSSTGKIPYADTSYVLAYHWNATKQLGFDLSGKYAESDYTCGSAVKTGNSSLRDDTMTTLSVGASYAFTSHVSASVGYTSDVGRNRLNNLPTNQYPDYRMFDREQVSLSFQYKF